MKRSGEWKKSGWVGKRGVGGDEIEIEEMAFEGVEWTTLVVMISQSLICCVECIVLYYRVSSSTTSHWFYLYLYLAHH